MFIKSMKFNSESLEDHLASILRLKVDLREDVNITENPFYRGS
jgi:hypothetical protein